MDNKTRIDIMREGWGEAISALEKCRIFLRALLENTWLGQRKNQVKMLLEDVEYAAKIAERDFRPEVVNASQNP